VDQNQFEEALRAGYAAINRGEEPEVDLIDEGFEGVNLPEQALGMPAMRGRDGLPIWLRRLRDVWDEFKLVPERITWLNRDAVLVEVLFQGRGKASAVPVTERLYNLWTLRDDRVIRLEVHRNQDEAISAVGAPSGQSSTRGEL
jgi:ketosteroid isomerase-like protein